MSTPRFFVSVGGQDVSSRFRPLVTDVTIRDAAGETSDTCSITLDDAGGAIALPAMGTRILASIEGASFDGFVDDVRSNGGRGQGMMLTISAKSADMRAEVKAQKETHKDDCTLEEAAQAFAPAGLSVKVDGSLASIERPYWSMNREPFMHWAQRTAREIGATFKIMGSTAVFVPRNGGTSASGRPLIPVTATRGVNLISWSIAPILSRPQFAGFAVSYYDPAEAKWKTETVQAQGASVAANATDRYAAADQGSAKDRAGAMDKESDREKGGGSVTILGNPAAQAEATCIVAGCRPGVDGVYRIDVAEHKLTRSGGYETKLTLKQPSGGAGRDGR